MDQSYEQFVSDGADRLLRTALLLTGERGAAEDLVQDVLERMFVHWRRVEEPHAYARAAMARRLTDRWRRAARRPREVELQQWHGAPVGDGSAARADRDGGVAAAAREGWRWPAAPQHRALLALWAETYARSLVDPGGAAGGFARQTVEDWLAVLAAAQPPRERRTRAGAAQRTLILAVLRGALLDLLATGDTARTTAAVEAVLEC